MTTFIARSKVHGTDGDSQAKLNAMPGFSEGDYSGGVWFFDFDHRSHVIISFVELYELVARYTEWYKQLKVDMIHLSKQAWLDSASLNSPDKWQQNLSGITLFWTALAECNITRLTLENLPDVLEFLLTHSWRGSRHFRLIGVQSCVNFRTMVSLLIWRSSFNNCGNEIIDFAITETRINKTISHLIPRLSDDSLTFEDWKSGGSFNYLTLDFGQYYIDHCMDFFEEHISTATAFASTLRKVPSLAEKFGFSESTTIRLVTKVLDGKSIEEIKSETSNIGWKSKTEILKQLHQECLEYFKVTYRAEQFKTIMLRESSLRTLLASMAIECSHTNIDRIKVIVWDWLNGSKATCNLSCAEIFSPQISWYQIDAAIKAMELAYSDETLSTHDASLHESIRIEHPPRSKETYQFPPRQLVKKVEQAGLTLIVALTGWRKTEYGFPLTSISQTPNHDILDQYAFPTRYHVNWYVKKTHGLEKVEREVTFDIALLIERLACLIASESRKPCLYRTRSKKKQNDSGIAVSASVIALWKHFVENYKGFKMIAELSAWQEIASAEQELTPNQIAEKNRLLLIRSGDEWSNLPFDVNLYECWHRARNELPIIDFVFLHSGSSQKNKWLSQYRKGTLRREWCDLIDKRLPTEVRNWIMSLTEAEALVNVTVREITHLLTRDCLYPTPHAFRHMFAEAIYRRYDGDVGWMIRSCFKHISRVMWQAYIRDKFNRASLDMTKLNLRNSLVLNYIKKKGSGYSGSIHKWLRRLTRNSAVMTTEEQVEFADRISTVEIMDIKASPWGYCILKKRSKSRALCATLGEPQRQNASPSLCLNCTHNLMQSGNVDWILLHLQTHVDILRNQLVPDLFRRPSYDLIKNEIKHILNIDPTHDALQELQSALDHYERN